MNILLPMICQLSAKKMCSNEHVTLAETGQHSERRTAQLIHKCRPAHRSHINEISHNSQFQTEFIEFTTLILTKTKKDTKGLRVIKLQSN